MDMLSVALRKESVDRNQLDELHKQFALKSLSARRAWIEILKLSPMVSALFVALRKESVDRNCLRAALLASLGGRSPQGERG